MRSGSSKSSACVSRLLIGSLGAVGAAVGCAADGTDPSVRSRATTTDTPPAPTTEGIDAGSVVVGVDDPTLTPGGSGGAQGAGGWGPTSDAGPLAPLLPSGPPGPWDLGLAIPEYEQKLGDPAAGYEYLTSAGYFGCGVPARFFGIVEPFATLPGISSEPLPGRDATVGLTPLGYTWNLSQNEDGVDVVYMNCLQCHAGKFNGELIVGLGNADADWTVNLGDMAPAADLLALLGPTPDEKKELDKFIGRLRVIGGPAVMRTVGTNPAEMLATTFVSHRDRNTLEWSDTALLSIPAIDDLPQGDTVTSKTPPWWRMSKKNAQFYNGMGRGDHRRSMMLAGSLCTDSVPQAEAIDAHFDDVAAYIASIPPPTYPFAIDTALAEEGHIVYLDQCAGCHGTYAPDPVSYPDLLIPQDEIQTDPVVGLGGTTPENGSDLVDWYNESWYGEVGHYEPFSGYNAPPLDAVWATAPYLHNGSVPDIETLLDSMKRPTYWRRVDHDTTNYDEETLGFPWVELSTGQSAPPFGVAAKDVYDTTLFSHSNSGHTYGDSLTAPERRAVIEYLKTL